MKKKYSIAIVIAIISVLLGLFAALFVFPQKIKINAEVNAEFDLKTLEGYTNYKDLKMTYKDKEIKIDQEIVAFENLGVYKISGNGKRYEINVKDTTAPVAHLMGSLMKLQATDEIELPEVRVVDNYDDNITDYSVAVSYGEQDVPIENNLFYVPEMGEYVIRLVAEDSSNNKGVNEKIINVTPLFDKRVKAGERVEIRPTWISYLLPEGKNVDDYEFSYKIYRNGFLLDTKLNEFIAEGNCYYNVCITAKSKADAKEQYSGWIIFVEEHCNILTFTTMTTDEVGNAGYNLICNPYKQIERSVEEFGDGRFAMKLDVDVANLVDKKNTEQILLAWTVDAWGLPRENWVYDASFNLTLKGKLKNNVTSTIFSAGGYSNNVQEFTVNSKTGEFEISEVISTKEIALFTEGGVSRVYYTLALEKDHLQELEIYIDNFQLTPRVDPIFTGKTYLPKEKGDKVPLTVEGLELSATDCLGGTVQSIEITNVEKFVESATARRVAFKGETLSDTGIYFVTCLVKDYYGNQVEQEVIVSIGMGILDVTAPEIIVETVDNIVAAGTKVALLDDGITDYLTIKDESKYTTTYEVYKNGEKTKVKTFTVGKYDRYEVYVTATDSSILRNASKGYIMFLGEGLKGVISTVNDDKYNVVNYGGESHLRLGDVTKAYFYPFKAEIMNEGGNRYVKLIPSNVQVGTMEILFPTGRDERGIVANFDFKIGGTLSGNLSDDAVLFEIGEEVVKVKDVKNNKRFSVSITNLYNRLPNESGLRTQAVYFENCANFLAESGLYLCVDNIQREKVFTDNYSEANSFEKLSLKKGSIIIDSKTTALQLVDDTKFELKYEVYKNGSSLVNKTEIVREGYEFYKVVVKVCYKGTSQELARFNMTFQWKADSFITMENGEKFYLVQGKKGKPSYHQLLDSRSTAVMEMYPFMGDMKKDATNNTYMSLKPTVIHKGAGLTLVNMKDASEHKADIGFEFWVEGDVSGIPAGTTLITVGTHEIKVEDVGKKFNYQNRVTFNNRFSEVVRVSTYDVLFEKGLSLCIDNVWRNKVVEEKIFSKEYKQVIECNKIVLSQTGIIIDGNQQVLQLADNNKYQLSYTVYKNGVELINKTELNREKMDFYSVTVNVNNKTTQTVQSQFIMMFVGDIDSFQSMEEGEKFYRISKPTIVYDQLLDKRDTFMMNLYPFTANMEEVQGNTYIALKVSDTTKELTLGYVNIKDSSSHMADVGFNYWLEGDVSGYDSETVVCKIGTQTVKVKDIGKKFYYQDRIAFNGCWGDNIVIIEDGVFKENKLTLCIDNVWRNKLDDISGIYKTTNKGDKFVLSTSDVVADDKNTILQVSDAQNYEFTYEIYKNGVEKLNETTINCEGVDFYDVYVSVLNKATNEVCNKLYLCLIGDQDDFQSMNEGEKAYRVPATPTRHEYDQLLNKKDEMKLSIYPFRLELKENEYGNAYIALEASAYDSKANITFVNVDASETDVHKEAIGFTFWVEGDATTLAADTDIISVGEQTIKASDINKKFFYFDAKHVFNGMWGIEVPISNYQVLRDKGLKLCIDNAWRKRVVETNHNTHVLDFESSKIKAVDEWNDDLTMLVKKFDKAEVVTIDNNKKLQVTASSEKWQASRKINGTQYKGIEFVYGLGLFNLPMSNTGQYSGTVEISIEAEFVSEAKASTVYIGRPEYPWASLTLGSDGKYSGTVNLEQVAIFDFSVATSPYNCPYAVYNQVMFDPSIISGVKVTVDNFALTKVIPGLLDFENSEIKAVDEWNDDLTMLVKKYDKAEVVTIDNNKKLQVTASSEKWQASRKINGTQYKGIEFVYGLGLFNLPMSNTDQYSGTVEISIEAEFVSEAKASTVYIGRPEYPWASLTLGSDGKYSGTVNLEQVAIFDFSVATSPYNCPYAVYNQVMFDPSIISGVKVTVDNFALTKVIPGLLDFENSEIKAVDEWNDDLTMLVKKYDKAEVVTIDNNKKLQVTASSEKWQASRKINGTQYKGIEFIYGLGLFNLPMSNTDQYSGTVEISIEAEFVSEAKASTVYIGRPEYPWASLTLGSDGKYSGTVNLEQVAIFDFSVDTSPYNCPYAVYNRVMFDPSIISGVKVTVDNFRLTAK